MSSPSNVWVVDDDKSIRWVLEKALSQAGIHTQTFDDGEQLLLQLNHEYPDVIITDIRMPNINGHELLEIIQQRCPQIPTIVMTAHSDLDSAVISYQKGAFDYLPKPFDVDEAVALVKRALTLRQNIPEHPANEFVNPAPEIIGEAPAMQEVFKAIGRLSHSNITVLINGESGTGKELVARALHKHSPRAEHPFIALNMAAIPKELVESELFGHEKGAFTGAAQQRRGRFEQADGGTLFLDEIGDMPLDSQTRLLRVLSDSQFYRVGGHAPVHVNVRIVTATHQNLENLVQQGKFREDLFHRLNVIRIQIPKLNDRQEDIPKLAYYFLAKAAQELSAEPKILLPETAEYLKQVNWKGNVRQLENVCRWLTVMASGREIVIDDLPDELKLPAQQVAVVAPQWQQALQLWAEQELKKGGKDLLNRMTPEIEKVMIQVALKHTSGRRRDAADLLGWGRNTLTRKLKEFNMNTGEDEEES